MDIWIWKNDARLGPYSEQEIAAHISEGTFVSEDLAWTEEQADWKPLIKLLPHAFPSPESAAIQTQKKRRLLLIVGLLCFAVISVLAYGKIKENSRRQQIQRQIQAQIAERQKEQLRQEQERLDAHRRQVEAQRRQDEKARQAQEDRNKKLAEQRRLEDEHRKEAERQDAERRDAERKAEEQRKQAEQEKEALAKKQEQEQCKEYAEKLFSQVSLSPNVTLCSSLQRLHSTVELKGEDLDLLKPLLEQKKYLDLINAIEKKYPNAKHDWKEYPSKSTISEVLNSLKWRKFYLLLKTSYNPRRTEGNEVASYEVWDLHYISPSSYDDGSIYAPGKADGNAGWTPHPDGIGYIRDWKVDAPPAIIVAGKYNVIGNAIRPLNDATSKQIDILKQKKKLGEIDEASYNEKLKEIKQATWESFLKWAATL